MGVFKNRGTPKWMVKIMENPINPWMIWGDFTHYFRKHPYSFCRKKKQNLSFFSRPMAIRSSALKISSESISSGLSNKTSTRCISQISAEMQPPEPETSIQKKWVADSIGRWFPKFFTLGNDWKFTRSPFRLKTTGSVGVPEVKER